MSQCYTGQVVANRVPCAHSSPNACDDCREARIVADKQRYRDKNRAKERKRSRLRSKQPKHVAYRKAYNARPEVKKRHLEIKRRSAGIKNPEIFDTLFELQNHRCAICLSETTRSKRNWHADHDHNTGLMRGVLCHHCNVLLGHAQDNPETLKRAIEYLANPPTTKLGEAS